MPHMRKSSLAVLCLLCQMPGQPAWSFDAATLQDPIFLCQFGDTARAYAFTRSADGQWQGQGALQSWTVTVQDDGLVARNADDVLILGNGTASLLTEDGLARGVCVDPRMELAQLFETEEGSDPGRDNPEGDGHMSPDLPMDAAHSPNDPWLAGVLAILDQANWDADQIAELIDALNLETTAKQGLRAELKAAAKDPARLRGLARQIRTAFGLEIAASAELRVQLRETRRELAAVTRAYEEQRQQARATTALLAEAQTKSRAAERANARALAEIASLKATLNTAITAEDAMRSRFEAAVAQLSATRENLAQANKRIVKLGGVPVRP